jgi:hypothetical protein
MGIVVLLATTPGRIQALVRNDGPVTVIVDEIILPSEAETIFLRQPDFRVQSGRVEPNSTEGLLDIGIAGLRGAVVGTAMYYRVDCSAKSDPLNLA